MFSYNVAIVKGITAFRAEPGSLGGIGRLPATLVAAILGDTRGLLTSAVGAELSGVLLSAGAGPAAVIGGFGTAALGAEFSGSRCTAGALPAVHGGSRLLCRLLLLAHLEQLGCIHAACLLGHAHTHKAHHGTVGVGCGSLHSFRLGTHHMGGSHIGIAEDSSLLQFLDGRFVFRGKW